MYNKIATIFFNIIKNQMLYDIKNLYIFFFYI